MKVFAYMVNLVLEMFGVFVYDVVRYMYSLTKSAAYSILEMLRILPQ
jgi:hypothetical protein